METHSLLAVATSQGQSGLSTWAVAAFWIGFFVLILDAVRRQERRRRLKHQPHSHRDTALLFLSALVLIGIILAVVFLQQKALQLHIPRLGATAIILLVGGGLTYIFNRKTKQRPNSE